MITATFWDRQGRELQVSGEPGTNFGLRIGAAEVIRLMKVSGNDLPFDIMAEGYGQDEDWVGLSLDDVYDGEHWDTPDELASSGWAPFEVSVEVGLAEGRVKYFGDDMNRLALEARSRIQPEDPYKIVSDLVGRDGADEIIGALENAGYRIEGGDVEQRDPAKLYEFLRDAEWTPDYEPGVQRISFPESQGLADLVGWSCVSCKEDVGWVKHESAYRTATGTITFSFDCGHCGYGEGETFDLYGEEIDRWSDKD